MGVCEDTGRTLETFWRNVDECPGQKFPLLSRSFQHRPTVLQRFSKTRPGLPLYARPTVPQDAIWLAAFSPAGGARRRLSCTRAPPPLKKTPPNAARSHLPHSQVGLKPATPSDQRNIPFRVHRPRNAHGTTRGGGGGGLSIGGGGLAFRKKVGVICIRYLLEVVNSAPSRTRWTSPDKLLHARATVFLDDIRPEALRTIGGIRHVDQRPGARPSRSRR